MESPPVDDKPTVKPGPNESDGPVKPLEDAWATPPLPAADETGQPGSSRNLQGVDPEASAIVEAAFEAALMPSAKPESIPPDVSSTEISVDELMEIEQSENGDAPAADEEGVLEKRDANHIPDDEFDNAPRAPGASIPPDGDEKGSSTSFKTIQTLALLEAELGIKPDSLATLSDDDADRIRRVMLQGKWCATEDDSRFVVVTILKAIEKRFTRSSNWEKQTFTQLKGTFLGELKRRGGNMEKLAERLHKVPPPMPKQSSAHKPPTAPRPDPPPKYRK